MLDREGADTYSARDMETLGLFANQAAVAIEQSHAQGSVAAYFREALRPSAVAANHRNRGSDEEVEDFASGVEGDASHRRTLELAWLAGEISRRGEQEAMACRTILQGFADYLRSRPEDSDEMMGDFG